MFEDWRGFWGEQFTNSTFNKEGAPLPEMNGSPHTIHLTANAVPHVRHSPIPISKHWEADVKAQLDEDERMGIIEKIPAGEPTVHMVCANGRRPEVKRQAEADNRLPRAQQVLCT